jgi:hypothetical protein
LARRLQFEEYAPHTGHLPHDIVTDFLGNNHNYGHVNQHGFNYADHMSRDEEIAHQLQASLSLDPHDHHAESYRVSSGYEENNDYSHQHGSVVPDWVGAPYTQQNYDHSHQYGYGSSDAHTSQGQDGSSWMYPHGSYWPNY